ncbi:hypothetical protein BH11PLA1_BH11PLA1_05800 [soil metagenome]
MPPEPKQTNAYLANRVLAASPAELRLMLLDGALKFATQGRDALAAKNFEGCFNAFTRCRAILVELVSGMKPHPNPELYHRLTALYMFMIARLLQASHDKDAAKAEEVMTLLSYERETWVLAMEKAVKEAPAAGAKMSVRHELAPAGNAPLSIAG